MHVLTWTMLLIFTGIFLSMKYFKVIHIFMFTSFATFGYIALDVSIIFLLWTFCFVLNALFLHY